MAPLCFHGNRKPAGAYTHSRNRFRIAVEGDKFLYPVAIPVHNGTAALQVAQALLTRVYHQQNTAVLRGKLLFRQIFCTQHQSSHVGGVVPYTGAEYFSVCLCKGQGICIRENHIGMGKKHHQGALSVIPNGIHHIQGIVHINALCPNILQIFFTVGGTAFLLPGGCRKLGQLQKLMIGLRCIFLYVGKDILGKHSFISLFLSGKKLLAGNTRLGHTVGI